MEANTLNEIMKTMAVTYRYTFRDCTEDMMQRLMVAWFESLRSYTDDEVLNAFRICLLRCKTPPSVADIIETIERVKDLNRPSKAEIWERLLKAVDKLKRQVYTETNGWVALYTLRNEACCEVYNTLPRSVRRWLGFECFCSYATYSETALSVERARFMKEIDGIRDIYRAQAQVKNNNLLGGQTGVKGCINGR